MGNVKQLAEQDNDSIARELDDASIRKEPVGLATVQGLFGDELTGAILGSKKHGAVTHRDGFEAQPLHETKKKDV